MVDFNEKNSIGDIIYICVDVNSQAYMQEVGICSNCEERSD